MLGPQALAPLGLQVWDRVQSIREVLDRLRWKPVQAEVLSNRILFTPDGLETDDQPRIDAHAVVLICGYDAGDGYRETSVRPVYGEPLMFPFRKEAEAFAAQLPPGTRRTIWVDPADHSRAVFIRWRREVWPRLALDLLSLASTATLLIAALVISVIILAYAIWPQVTDPTQPRGFVAEDRR